MDKKEYWPLCSTTIVRACFDVKTDMMRPGPRGKRHIDGRAIPQKSYDQEVVWGGAE